MPLTAILYARSQHREDLDRQIRELEDWCERAGVVAVEKVAEVALGLRTSKRCHAVLAAVAGGRADLVLIRDLSRLSENVDQLRQIVDEHRQRIAFSRDDAQF
ncbi:MAG: recombinase family protein [Pseudonocardiaceae bacterium]